MAVDRSSALEEYMNSNAATLATSHAPEKQIGDEPASIKQELSEGLLARHAFISPKYFYDAIGSVLFEAICVLPEYYLTRTEAGIFDRYQTEIAQYIQPGSTLIDLGAGNCAKAARLFPVLHPKHYVPIDISVKHLTDATERLQQRFPQIKMMALGRDFFQPWTLPVQVDAAQRVFFFPGSSIGNFDPEVARSFLKHIRALCVDEGGILIGIDLAKDASILNAAYNDSLGITAACNLNALRHVNELLGSNFDVNEWRHVVQINEGQSRVEMYLEACGDLNVCWDTQCRHFNSGERIHTENSYKYSLPSFLAILNEVGFGAARYWTDENAWCAVIYAKAI